MPSISPERYAQGMTFSEYLDYIGTPRNLAREATGGTARPDNTAAFKNGYENTELNENQVAALKWLAAQAGGPAKILAISEDWSSDCQRDIPTVARMAEAAGMELRIFTRDGAKFSASNSPSLDEAPDSNADIMVQFLNQKNGQTWQSIPVVAFFTSDLEFLTQYIEYPSMYDKDGVVVGVIRAPRPGETPEQTAERGGREFTELRASPFFKIWASAAVDEMASGLHRRLLIGG